MISGLGLRAAWDRQAAGEKLALVMVLVGLFVFAFSIDRPLAQAMHDLRDTPVKPAFEAMTRLGKSDIWFIGSLILLGVFGFMSGFTAFIERARRFWTWARYCRLMFVAVAASGIAVNLLKPVFGRARPRMLFGEDGLYGFDWWRLGSDFGSFPSGHTATAVSVGIVCALIWPRWRWPILLAAGLVAFSRVGVTAHYLSDVLAGTVLAIVTTAAVLAWFQKRGLALPKGRA